MRNNEWQAQSFLNQKNYQLETTQYQNIKPHIKISRKANFRLFLAILTIIITSFQIYFVTTDKVDHSRSFIRCLNYYILQHTDFGIYWVGQYANNYPMHQYYQLGQVQLFLDRTISILSSLDQFAYGKMDIQTFCSQQHKIIVQQKTGEINTFPFVINQGFVQPFQTQDIDSLKKIFLSSEQMMILLEDFKINEHLWSLSFSITPFSDTSIWVQIFAKEKINLFSDHLLSFLCGVALLIFLIQQYLNNPKSIYLNIPDYLLSVFLINNFLFCLSKQINFEIIIILDGIACLISWLIILKFLSRQDYHVGFLLKQSYVLVGKLFISFAPIFIAFCIFAYCCFCRQSGQFSTFKRTFLSLFYISYYNMTYQSIIVTSRSNPISMIFFFIFVILFTICVYSGMLVSVFCSYVWNKRQNRVKQDIISNLKIECSSCNYKYKYIDCLTMMKNKKKSLRLSHILQTNFNNSEEKTQYKNALKVKITGMTSNMIHFLQQGSRISQSKHYTKIQREKWVHELSQFLQKTIKIRQNKQFQMKKQNEQLQTKNKKQQ